MTEQLKNEKYCVNCGEKIDEKAEICPKCGVKVPSKIPEYKKKNPVDIALMSFLMTGWGQTHNKQVAKGLLLFIIQVINGFLMIVGNWIGFIAFPIWIWAIYDAYKTAKKINEDYEYS